jgi:hypothetical protein
MRDLVLWVAQTSIGGERRRSAKIVCTLARGLRGSRNITAATTQEKGMFQSRRDRGHRAGEDYGDYDDGNFRGLSAETHDRNERAGIQREGGKSAMPIQARATRNDDEKHTDVVI